MSGGGVLVGNGVWIAGGTDCYSCHMVYSVDYGDLGVYIYVWVFSVFCGGFVQDATLGSEKKVLLGSKKGRCSEKEKMMTRDWRGV